MKVFPPFRLDSINRCLWRADDRLALTPKAFDVLSYLVEHRARLVTQHEILEAVWTDTHVNPEVVKKAVLEIRKVLGDRPDRPAFIETRRKRGYQFIAPVADSRTGGQQPSDALSGMRIVGREMAVARMDACLDRALTGQRQIVFITGEAGIGKTTLVDLFQQRAARRPEAVILRGQCIEGFGGKEAYYPILEALGDLVSQGQQSSIIQLLAKKAPAWLIQFGSLVEPEQKDALHREVLGTTRERMVREICEALEAIALETPVVLILEDLHWVDPSTVDVISALARRRLSARLVLAGTYRPYELLISGNPLRHLTQDLLVHRLCDEIVVEPIGRREIDEYLARVFPEHRFPPDLSGLIRRQSGGNALFMTTLVEDMTARSLLVQREGHWILSKSTEEIRTWIPGTLAQMLRLQFDQLSKDEQAVLTSGSVAGELFSMWAVSGMLAVTPDGVESICDRLAERDLFIRATGIHPAPDGSSSAHYEFRHSLFREAAYRRISNLNRSKLHKSYGERLRSVQSEARAEMASELALHFEEARDYAEAIKYLVQTAEQAGRRFAHRDAIQVLRRALEIVVRIPESQRVGLEIGILRRIGDANYALGAMSDSVEAYEQAAAAAVRAGQTAAQIESMISLALPACYTNLTRGLEVCAQAVEVSRNYGDPSILAQAEMAAATCRLLYDSWRREDAERYAAAAAMIEGLSSSSAPTYYQMLYVYVRAVQGDYRGALESADRAIREMAETVSPAAYLLALGAKALCLLHLGRFGDVLRIVRAGRETAERSEVDPWIFIFREAWLRSLCFDFQGVRRLGAVNIRIDPDRHAVQPAAIALVAAGRAELDQENYGKALEYFAQVLDTNATPNFFVHWHWRIQAHIGLTAALLRSGDIARARLEADRCLESAHSTADPNLKALALEMTARVAFADHDLPGSGQHIQNALAIVKEFDVPVAAWRVHAAAWELCPNREEAERHRAIARDTLWKIANSFDADEPLRASLLSAAPVQHLFGPISRVEHKSSSSECI
jgi:DNA-binding winged helix-turn-helix (wHTH) protein/tetratricopeptide (TPR) repeat protein